MVCVWGGGGGGRGGGGEKGGMDACKVLLGYTPCLSKQTVWTGDVKTQGSRTLKAQRGQSALGRRERKGSADTPSIGQYLATF